MKTKKGKNYLIVTDQGNGGRFCSVCRKELDGLVEKCPHCKSELEIDSDISDFGNHDTNRF